MIIISHRGLIDDTDPKWENHPDQIIQTIEDGFFVEADVRFINGEWWLGHDRPQYKISDTFLIRNAYRLIIHAKDIPTLHELFWLDVRIDCMQLVRSVVQLKRPWVNLTLNREKGHLHYFFHDQDDCTLTSHGYIWQYPKNIKLTSHSIACMPERVENWEGLNECWGICTDLPIKYDKRFNK